jgi:antitoxin YefM
MGAVSTQRRLDVAYAFPYDKNMEAVTVSEARERLYRLVGDVSAAGEPVLITGKRGNAVLLSEDDWRAIQETLYLLSVPGMRESIREGMTTRVADCAPELEW